MTNAPFLVMTVIPVVLDSTLALMARVSPFMKAFGGSMSRTPVIASVKTLTVNRPSYFHGTVGFMKSSTTFLGIENSFVLWSSRTHHYLFAFKHMREGRGILQKKKPACESFSEAGDVQRKRSTRIERFMSAAVAGVRM